jgi:hypothetical protein
MTETSKRSNFGERTRKWCESGAKRPLKITPEQHGETINNFQLIINKGQLLTDIPLLIAND